MSHMCDWIFAMSQASEVNSPQVDVEVTEEASHSQGKVATFLGIFTISLNAPSH
jgi:hypothetical protein